MRGQRSCVKVEKIKEKKITYGLKEFDVVGAGDEHARLHVAREVDEHHELEFQHGAPRTALDCQGSTMVRSCHRTARHTTRPTTRPTRRTKGIGHGGEDLARGAVVGESLAVAARVDDQDLHYNRTRTNISETKTIK